MSSTPSRTRFRVESAAAVLFGFLAVLTAIVPQWVETVFKVDPDAASGSLEWALVGVAGIAAVLLAVTARLEWHRLTVAT